MSLNMQSIREKLATSITKKQAWQSDISFADVTDFRTFDPLPRPWKYNRR